jgi:hypothetical protein
LYFIQSELYIAVAEPRALQMNFKILAVIISFQSSANTMKLENFEIQLDRPDATYLAGETVSGVLIIDTERAMTALKIGVTLTGQVSIFS